MSKIRLAIADDHSLFRKGLASLLVNYGDFEIVFDAENGKVLVDNLSEQSVDVVLIDLEMPVMRGEEAIEIIKTRFPTIKVLALTLHDDEVTITKVIGLGANGFLVEDDSIEAVAEAANTVIEKDYYFTQRVVKAIEKMAERAALKPKAFLIEFTKREIEIVELICHSYSTKEIACKLNTSIRTVEWHKQNVIQRTDSKNTAGLVFYAAKNGLVN